MCLYIIGAHLMIVKLLDEPQRNRGSAHNQTAAQKKKKGHNVEFITT